MPDTAIFAIIFVASYLIGSIPMAFLVVKWRYKADIRQYGSGQVGGSNLYRSFSKRWGYAVGIYDALKGAAIVLIAKLIGLETVFQVLIGIAMIAGHNWPVFLRFNAGRGLATTLGVCFVIFPFGIWIFIAGAVFTLLVGSSALPALVGMAAMPVASFIRGEPLETTLGLTALVAILIIRRLTAPISERSRQVKKSELLLNRFLFDRDIRDSKQWVHHRPDSAPDKAGRKEP